jgi:hypothetical protein
MLGPLLSVAEKGAAAYGRGREVALHTVEAEAGGGTGSGQSPNSGQSVDSLAFEFVDGQTGAKGSLLLHRPSRPAGPRAGAGTGAGAGAGGAGAGGAGAGAGAKGDGAEEAPQVSLFKDGGLALCELQAVAAAYSAALQRPPAAAAPPAFSPFGRLQRGPGGGPGGGGAMGSFPGQSGRASSGGGKQPAAGPGGGDEAPDDYMLDPDEARRKLEGLGVRVYDRASEQSQGVGWHMLAGNDAVKQV